MPSISPASSDPRPASPSPTPTADPAAADKAAIEKAYRSQFAEFNRLEMAGGATKLTQVLLDTTSGDHRAHYLEWLKEDKADDQRQLNPGKLDGVVVGSGNSKQRNVTACEDYKGVKITRHGKLVKPTGSALNLQHATAVKGSDGKWRIDLVRTTPVKSFKHSDCVRSR